MRTATKRRRPLWPALMLLTAAVGCFIAAYGRVRQTAREAADIEALRARGAARPSIVYVRLAGDPADAGSPAATPTPTPTPDPTAERVRALQAENAELVGWLTAPGAEVDLPVMQSPTRPNFYLDHDFSGAESKSGLLYIDEACDPAGVNRIVYGHNMKSGAMFGRLRRYLDADFFRENALFRYTTDGESRDYRVIAAYETTLDESAAFRFYTYTDIQDDERYREYVANVMARSAHDGGEAPAWGQKLLTLVTCVRYRPNDRLVVVAAECPR